MDLLCPGLLNGLSIFFMGVFILRVCSSIDRENHHNLKKSRMLEWYGRRRADSFATLPFAVKSGFMTFLGSSISMYGLFLTGCAIPWMDF